MKLKGKFIFGTNQLKSMHSFYIICIFHELSEDLCSQPRGRGGGEGLEMEGGDPRRTHSPWPLSCAARSVSYVLLKLTVLHKPHRNTMGLVGKGLGAPTVSDTVQKRHLKTLTLLY